MSPERELARIDLRAAKLCMELDCNTIFDAALYRHCPTCGSVEAYPIEAWLNRERSHRIPAAVVDTLSRDATARFKPLPRPLWLGRLRDKRVEGDAPAVPVKLRSRAQRRRVG